MNRFFNYGFLVESFELISHLDEAQFEALGAAVSSPSG